MQLDDEILQDFLVEAKETTKNLDSQLIELESSPNDSALVNAVFRAFRTLKGGAGFLNLQALVEIALRAEDVCDLLRKGTRAVTPRIMHALFRVHATLRTMFAALRAGAIPEQATPALLAELRSLASGNFGTGDAATPGSGEFDEVVAAMLNVETTPAVGASDVISDDEFDQMLDRLTPQESAAPAAASAHSGIITDDEFDALLDNLPGPSQTKAAAAAAAPDSCDHSVETSAERDRAGKAPTGRVKLSAEKIGDQVMPTLLVMLGNQVFALPLLNVKEIIAFKLAYAHDVNGEKTLMVREKALPLIYLSRWLVHEVPEYVSDRGHVVIVRVGNQMIGLLVDQLIGQAEVVFKPSGTLLHGTGGLSGATITGNGRIARMLDLPSLIDAYGRG